MLLPEQLNFIRGNQLWAIVGDSNSGHSDLVNSIKGKTIENVSFRHQFRNLSNTRDFYYQQRFNSTDSEDALTVSQHLQFISLSVRGFWNFENISETFYLDDLLNEQVIKLSNGETKRLMIASALMHNPELITLDHPLTGLDKETRKSFSSILQVINNAGTMVIIASHPLEIPEAITHIAVMERGEIIFHGEKSSYDPVHFSFDHPVSIDPQLLKGLVSGHFLNKFTTIIEMKNVSVEYDGKKILRNINWRVEQGDRWALSGPNGAGKSTLLSLVNGDNPQAYANDIILFDRKRGSGESIWDIKKQTGFVSPELYQYFPTDSLCLHVLESGFYDTVGLFRPTDPEKEKVCLQWMQLMKINEYSNYLFSRVPEAVQRLCLLARAMVKNPALLIMDEPTQGLDLSQQKFFTRLIDDICSLSDVTVIYVSHYEHHIPKAITKRIFLENGAQV